jgi:hypothetical protein
MDARLQLPRKSRIAQVQEREAPSVAQEGLEKSFSLHEYVYCRADLIVLKGGSIRARPEKGLSGQGRRDSKRVLKPNLEARDVDPDHSAAV